MFKSVIRVYKFLKIYSDGCINISYKTSNILKLDKKIIFWKKDHKLFFKLLKDKSSIKKENNYRNKVFLKQKYDTKNNCRKTS